MTSEIIWLLPESGWELERSDHPLGDGWRVDEAGFPQTLHEGAIPCGRTAQIDVYNDADVAGLTEDGLLHYGEDWDAILSWRFETAPACESAFSWLPDTGASVDILGIALLLAVVGAAALVVAHLRNRGTR